MTKSKLLEALNRIDELACAIADQENGEAQQLKDDYNLIFNFIEKHA
jgi:hypothetical protein